MFDFIHGEGKYKVIFSFVFYLFYEVKNFRAREEGRVRWELQELELGVVCKIWDKEV